MVATVLKDAVCVCVCPDLLSDQGRRSLARQRERFSKLCLPSFAQLRRNLIFTARLALRHTSQEVGTAARLVHWVSEIHTHRSLSLFFPAPFPPFSHPSTLNLTQGQP